MRTSTWCTATWACFLLLLPSFVLSRPSPLPKSANFRNWRIKNGMNKQTKRWTNDTSTAEPACAAASAQTVAAPYSNVWSSLTDDEAASVAAWLFSQPSFNLTKAEDAGEWDNSLLVDLRVLSSKLMLTTVLDL